MGTQNTTEKESIDAGGDFYTDLNEADEACEVPETGYCCSRGAIFAVPEAKCSAMEGYFFTDQQAAVDRCCEECDEAVPSAVEKSNWDAFVDWWCRLWNGDAGDTF